MLEDYVYPSFKSVYSFITDISNVSNFLSLIGIAITIRESRKAKNAAQAAETAAKNTKIQFQNIEMSVLIQECLHDAENLITKTDMDNWEAASSIATKIIKNLLSVKFSNGNDANPDIVTKISEMVVQFKIIILTTDRAQQNTGKPPNKVNIKKSIREQIGNLVEIHQHTKNALGNQI